MSNMGYCRFQNTLDDLRDCYRNMDNEVSDKEHKARIALVKLCVSISDEYKDTLEEGL